MNILKIIAGTAATALFMIAAAGCCKNNLDEPESADRRVLLFYECAFNDIGSYMRRNMEDQQKGLPAGHIPGKYGDVLLVYSRIAENGHTPVNSYLRRIYKTSKGKVISDTLKVFGKETIAASPPHPQRGADSRQGKVPRQQRVRDGVLLARFGLASRRLLLQPVQIRE